MLPPPSFYDKAPDQPQHRERDPLSAPGPFYVERHCCVSCLAPEAEAPDLMSFDQAEGSCYFRRQPSTPEELERAIRAVCVSCVGAVRYGGRDPEVLRRLEDEGRIGQADHPPQHS